MFNIITLEHKAKAFDCASFSGSRKVCRALQGPRSESLIGCGDESGFKCRATGGDVLKRLE